MLKLAGMPVAYRATPAVRSEASYELAYAPLSGVLEWFAPD